MHPFALPRRRPEVMRLAAEDARDELAVAVHRRSLPEQEPLNRQERMPWLVVAARGIREAIAGARHGFDDPGVEVTAWIREVIDALAKPALDLRPGLLELRGDPVR